MKLKERLEQIEQRLKNSTPGPWGWIQSAGRTIIRAEKPRTLADMLFVYPYKERHEDGVWSGQDAELIANCPADLTFTTAALRLALDTLEDYAARQGYYSEPEDAQECVASIQRLAGET